MSIGRWATKRLEWLWAWFFPPKREIPECLRPWLEKTFPGIDLDAVAFHDGLPDVINLARLGSRPPAAITLPSLLGVHGIRIHFREGVPDPSTRAGLALIAHEMVHVRQYRDWAGGYGVGFIRAFMLPYLLCAARHGYRDHSMEREARAFERAVVDGYDDDRRPCDGSTGDAGPNATGTADGSRGCDDVVFTKTSMDFRDRLWHGVPGLERWWRWTGRVRRSGGEYLRRRLRDEATRETAPEIAPGDYRAERSDDAHRSSSVPLDIRKRPLRLARRIVAVWVPGLSAGIGMTVVAAVLAALGVAYFALAMALLAAVTVAIALVWPIVKLAGAVACGVCAVVVAILRVLDRIERALFL